MISFIDGIHSGNNSVIQDREIKHSSVTDGNIESGWYMAYSFLFWTWSPPSSVAWRMLLLCWANAEPDTSARFSLCLHGSLLWGSVIQKSPRVGGGEGVTHHYNLKDVTGSWASVWADLPGKVIPPTLKGDCAGSAWKGLCTTETSVTHVSCSQH